MRSDETLPLVIALPNTSLKYTKQNHLHKEKDGIEPQSHLRDDNNSRHNLHYAEVKLARNQTESRGPYLFPVYGIANNFENRFSCFQIGFGSSKFIL